MHGRTTRVVTASLAAMLVIGCSSAPGAGSGAPGTPGSAPATSGAATNSAPASQAPTPAASPEPSVVDPTALDLCALISVDEVRGIIDDPVQPGEPLPSSRGAGCSWTAADASLLKYVHVTVTPFDQDNWDIGLRQGAEPVAGLGDDAYLREAEIRPVGILVIKHGTLMIELNLHEDPGDREVLTRQQRELAELVLSRL